MQHHRIVVIFALLVCAVPVASAQVVRKAYMPLGSSLLSGGPEVAVVDAETNTLLSTITGFTAAWGTAVAPDGASVYITDRSANNVRVIATSTDTIITTIPMVASCSEPYGVAVHPDGSKLWVTCASSGVLINVDLNSGSQIVIPVGSVPTGVAVRPNGTRVYVANRGSGTMTVVNASTLAVVTTVTVGSGPEWITARPDGDRVYVANVDDDTVSVVRTSNNTIEATISVPYRPSGLTANLASTRVYVASWNFSPSGPAVISTIDTATNAITGSCDIVGESGGSNFFPTPQGIQVNPQDSSIFVSTVLIGFLATNNRLVVVDRESCANSLTDPGFAFNRVAISFGDSFVMPPALPYPTYSNIESACQSAITNNAQTYANALTDQLQICLGNVLDDMAARVSLIEVGADCWSRLSREGSSTVLTKRANAENGIRGGASSGCRVGKPNEVDPDRIGNPCTGGTDWDAIIACVLDEVEDKVVRMVESQFGDACTLTTAVGLDLQYPLLCP